jgi:hypothetical protein
MAMTAFAGVVTSPLFATGCQTTGVGDPCTPESEYNTDFAGFSEKEVNVESKSYQCQTRLCLVNHFRGRVSCPYGQQSDGTVDPGTGATDSCWVPGTAPNPPPNPSPGPLATPYTPNRITGPLVNPNDPNSPPADTKNQHAVPAQCTERKAADSVYCSCRCADINGGQGGNSVYCKCPQGFHCSQLVGTIGQGNEGLTGGYCVKDNHDYDISGTCTSCTTNDKCGDARNTGQ